jgi:hypothetical protein
MEVSGQLHAPAALIPGKEPCTINDESVHFCSGDAVYLLAYFPYFERIKVGCLCVCVSPPIKFRMAEAVFMKLGMYIMAPELISKAYFINPSHQSVSVFVSLYRC